MNKKCTIGIDLGGTNIKGGVLSADNKLLISDSIATEADHGSEHVIGRMAGLVASLMKQGGLSKADVGAVGVGAPGPMSHAAGLIHSAPNLPGFVNLPLRDRLAKLCGLPVVLENDANAAAFGEFAAGAGAAVQDMVMFTLGTGVGGGIILGGKLVRGHFDNAGEVGHAIIVPGGRPCPCGQLGCLERYASANAVAERLKEAVEAGATCSLASHIARGDELDARHVVAAADAGDQLAQRIWDETCYYLALGVVNIQHMVNPELVVFAGGLVHAGDRLLLPVREHFKRLVWKSAPDAPRIELATLGNDAGTIGAAALARDVQS